MIGKKITVCMTLFLCSIFLVHASNNQRNAPKTAATIYYCPLIPTKISIINGVAQSPSNYYAGQTQRLANIEFYWVKQDEKLEILSTEYFNKLLGKKVQQTYAKLNPTDAVIKTKKSKKSFNAYDFFFKQHKTATTRTIAFCSISALILGTYAYCWTNGKDLPGIKTIEPLFKKLPFLAVRHAAFINAVLESKMAETVTSLTDKTL